MKLSVSLRHHGVPLWKNFSMNCADCLQSPHQDCKLFRWGSIIIFKMHELAGISYYHLSWTYCRALGKGFFKDLRIFIWFSVSVCIEPLHAGQSAGLFYCMGLAYLYYSNASNSLSLLLSTLNVSILIFTFHPVVLLSLIGRTKIIGLLSQYLYLSLLFLKSIHMYEQINRLYFSPWRKRSIYFICTSWEKQIKPFPFSRLQIKTFLTFHELFKSVHK